MNNFKYDFNRGRPADAPGRKVRFALLFAAVLAVTGGIVYFLIPRDASTAVGSTGKAAGNSTEPPGSTADAISKAPEAGLKGASAASKGEAESTATASVETAESAPGDTSGAAAAEASAAKTEAAATDAPEKGKPWIGDAPETPKPASPSADAELKLTDEKLKPVYAGNISSVAERIVVAPGDSLSRIAVRKHTTVEALRHYNHLKKDVIRIGQKLYLIPGPGRITVDKSRRELLLERSKDGAWSAFGRFQVGLGRLDRTPEAEFVISDRLRHPVWYAPDGRIFRYGDEGNQLGDYFLKLAAAGRPDKPLRGFGIHGTGDDSTVGRNWSNGCVRMHNRDVELLYYLVPSGTPVRIVPGATGTEKAENK